MVQVSVPFTDEDIRNGVPELLALHARLASDGSDRGLWVLRGAAAVLGVAFGHLSEIEALDAYQEASESGFASALDDMANVTDGWLDGWHKALEVVPATSTVHRWLALV